MYTFYCFRVSVSAFTSPGLIGLRLSAYVPVSPLASPTILALPWMILGGGRTGSTPPIPKVRPHPVSNLYSVGSNSPPISACKHWYQLYRMTNQLGDDTHNNDINRIAIKSRINCFVCHTHSWFLCCADFCEQCARHLTKCLRYFLNIPSVCWVSSPIFREFWSMHLESCTELPLWPHLCGICKVYCHLTTCIQSRPHTWLKFFLCQITTICPCKKWPTTIWLSTAAMWDMGLLVAPVYRVTPWRKGSVLDALTRMTVGNARLSTWMSSKHRCDSASYALSLGTTTSPQNIAKMKKHKHAIASAHPPFGCILLPHLLAKIWRIIGSRCWTLASVFFFAAFNMYSNFGIEPICGFPIPRLICSNLTAAK